MQPRLLKIFEWINHENLTVFLPDIYVGADRPYRYYRRTFSTTLKNARLPDGGSLWDDIDFYSFRHIARSAMANCGIPAEIAETIIGHQTMHNNNMIFVYTHLSDDDLIKEIVKLEYPLLEQVKPA